MDVLTPVDRLDPLYLKIEEYMTARIALHIGRLVNKEDPEVRGRIKELQFLLTPPAEPHTAQ